MQTKSDALVWSGLALIALTTLLITLGLKPLARPVKPLPVYGPIADFTLTNQDGRVICLQDLRGHVWVADIIFTRCPGPCLKMTRHMQELQLALPTDTQTRLVTLTTDPDYDTPSILQTYGGRFGAQLPRWMFLTG